MSPLREKAKALVEAVQRDDTGVLVGQEWRGGNGGLLSQDTLVAADALRREIMIEEAKERAKP